MNFLLSNFLQSLPPSEALSAPFSNTCSLRSRLYGGSQTASANSSRVSGIRAGPNRAWKLNAAEQRSEISDVDKVFVVPKHRKQQPI